MLVFNNRLFYFEENNSMAVGKSECCHFGVFLRIALGGNWIFLYQSYDYTTIANATLGYYFAPVFVMLLSPYVLKEPLSWKKIVCVLVAITGLVCIVGEGLSASKTDDLLGLFLWINCRRFLRYIIVIK
ncbi:hypothetical protein LSPH24S_05277 [Lysinibacillus sphaericus]